MIHRDIDNHSNSIDEGVEDEEKSNDIEQILERKSPLVVVKYFRQIARRAEASIQSSLK